MSDLRVPDLNHITIAGRLTRDPELKYTNAGKPVCKLSIANSRYYKDRDGQRTEETTFVDVTAWGPMAEWIGQRLTKGRPVIVEGRLRMQEWEDRATGQKRSKLDIDASRVTPLDWDDDKGGGARAGTRPQSNTSRGNDEPIPEDDIPF